jgi:mitogen-activated protein kinase 1/3
MQGSSSTNFKAPGVLKARGINRSGSNSDFHQSTSTTKETSLTSRSTPLSNFSNKFNIWKKKRAAQSSLKNIRNKGNSNPENKAKKMFYGVERHPSQPSRRSDKTKPVPKPIPERRSSRIKERSTTRTRKVDYNEAMLNQVVDGMSRMRSSSRDDYTEVTSSSTQPSLSSSKPTFSLSGDEGSTIVSEITTDSSYAYHTFKVDKHKFTVDKRYSMLRTVGSGAYGVVISAKDFSSGTDVAIKMVPKAFHDEVDAKRILREIKLLKHFNHENIITIQDMMPPLARHVGDFRDVYIVTDLMETDLHRIIYSKQSLSIDHVQYFMYQILRALKYMHSANVIHRDLKPSNLLVNSNCDLKVCDFGLARGISPTHDEDLENDRKHSLLLTEYVVTRWYRAPEIMLACHEYSKPIDLWSVGCIFAELLGRKPFLAGDDYIDQVRTIAKLTKILHAFQQSLTNILDYFQQLTLITEKLGNVPERDMDFITSSKARNFLRKLPKKDPVPLSKQFPNATNVAIDLLSRLLAIHPRKRINVAEALSHPFFKSMHNPDDEPIAGASFDFSFENEKLHRERLQELIWQEVGDFRPSCLPVPPRVDSRRLYHA